jgi:DNA-binding NtrC family response regulator
MLCWLLDRFVENRRDNDKGPERSPQTGTGGTSLYNGQFPYLNLLKFQEFKTRSLKTKLVLGMIPPIVIILALTGYITYRVSRSFINSALERSVKIQTMAVAHELDTFLETCKRDLLFIARNSISEAELHNFIARKEHVSGLEYHVLAFLSKIDDRHFLIFAQNGRILELPPGSLDQVRPNPLLLFEQFKDLNPDEVWISPITEVEHPFPSKDNLNFKLQTRLIYLATPYENADGTQKGFLLLAVDARCLRNILSLYNSPRSPLWAFARTQEVRYSFMFDKDGWILFQSEDPSSPDMELSTYLARAGYTGTQGRPGLPEAFRPAAHFGPFWKMVQDIREGRFGLIDPESYNQPALELKEHFLAYAPVLFRPAPNSAPFCYAGVAYVDVSHLTMAAGYKQMDVIFIITLGAILAVSLFIYLLGWRITRPILELSHAVDRIKETGEWRTIELPYVGYEITLLQNATNRMISTMQHQLEEIRRKEKVIETVSLKERVSLNGPDQKAAPAGWSEGLQQIVGVGMKIDSLKSDIRKAAAVGVDVLVLGETGTGKQLAAEAIHNLSSRKNKPFISINCGALDENLLLDALFGHTKGAFTEARTERKGAFLEADGGTLFLDDIQAASPRVQQALLRAVAARKIRPLGSDREVDVNVRIIAASNADLALLIETQHFREDLYYRLKVITIRTPPLREHLESLPALAAYFIKQDAQVSGHRDLGISRGGLEKMQRYAWPGNVRELKNCITRAAVMAENSLIHAHDLHLESDFEDWGPAQEQSPEKGPASPRQAEVGVDRKTAAVPGLLDIDESELNRRQRQVLPTILLLGEITRGEYQALAGNNLSPRTAVYDLQDLVRKGILTKRGQGRATRYVIVGSRHNRMP